MNKIKAPPVKRREESRSKAVRPHRPSPKGNGRSASGVSARKTVKRSPKAQPGWLARRPARPLHPATPIDEMAGIVIVAGAMLLGLLAVAPHMVGALSPLGVRLQELTGHGALVLAACVMLVGLEAFIPHQALGVPLLALSLGVLFMCLEGLGGLMGGEGGSIGATVADWLSRAVGVYGAWIVLATMIIIDIQWITRVSMRGPARVLILPFRVAWRGGRLMLRLARMLVVRGVRGLGRFADEGGEVGRRECATRSSVVAQSEDFVPPPSVKPHADADASTATVSADRKRAPKGSDGGRGLVEGSPKPSGDLPNDADFPPLLHGSGKAPARVVARPVVRAHEAAGDESVTNDDDDDPEIPGYEEDDVQKSTVSVSSQKAQKSNGQTPMFDEEPTFDDAPPFEPDDAPVGKDDPANDGHELLKRTWAEQESPGTKQLSLPLPAVPTEPPPRAVPRSVPYRLPPVELLNNAAISAGNDAAIDFSRIIVETLNSFGVATRIVNVEKGPTVTRYELQPARGVKVSKITSLNNDIALALAAQAIRIEAPIPGKSAIGIEVPNSRVDAVPMREIIESGAFQNGQGCMLALGKDISGRSVVADLLRMPHLLIAGATGSGKSVCLNTVIVSMLYRFTPEQVQMVMVDPKRVELSIFEGIPHLANTHANPNQRIVKDAKTGTLVLKQATEIMNQRFELLSQTRVRNIAEYNAKVDVPMPFLVIIVDELAQLMQISARSVEGYLQELAQMGRAAGIHLILATQRPSVDVLTGTIKSNFPARIAFAVSAQVDSRTILDRGGAEKLLGRGDMLFSPTDAELRRVQGCLITLEETERVVDFWRKQEAPDNLAQLSLESKTTDDLLAAGGKGEEGDDEDLLREALRVIKDTKLASASNLQRKLQIGYPRAARLVDELEERGFLGPANGSKPRKILFLEQVE